MFEEMFKLAKISTKITDKGIELSIGTRKVGTFVEIAGATRLIYPKGSESLHTTMWGTSLTTAIYRTKLSLLQGVVGDEQLKAI